MAFANLRRDEAAGLALALVLHAAILGALIWRPAVAPVPVPQRMTVTLSDQVAPQSTSPEPAASPQQELAPMLGEAQPVSVPEPTPLPKAPPPKKIEIEKAVPPPLPRIEPQPKPDRPTPDRPKPDRPKPEKAKPEKPKPEKAKPTEKTKPAEQPRPVEQKQPTKPARARSAPAPDPIASVIRSTRASERSERADKAKAATSFADAFRDAPAKPAKKPAGASAIGKDFLAGSSASASVGKAKAVPAAAIGADVRASLVSAIARQIKPHWSAPQGADADQLVTVLAWDLKLDGSLDGAVRVVRQEGINPSNQPQARLHAEQAVRAVELSAPFPLDPQYYAAWHHVTAFRFDRKLSQ